jgi:hypothetical protein
MIRPFAAINKAAAKPMRHPPIKAETGVKASQSTVMIHPENP